MDPITQTIELLIRLEVCVAAIEARDISDDQWDRIENMYDTIGMYVADISRARDYIP